jgi:hypothetical protein
MPMTANTMSAMIIAGLNISDKRLLEIKWLMGFLPVHQFIYIVAVV